MSEGESLEIQSEDFCKNDRHKFKLFYLLSHFQNCIFSPIYFARGVTIFSILKQRKIAVIVMEWS
jgi:hypothetical protein